MDQIRSNADVYECICVKVAKCAKNISYLFVI